VKAFSFGRTEIRIYGGYGSVGGNCVVIRSPSVSVMLDQGVNFAQLRRFYGLSIQPDSVEELRRMGVLPPREAYEGVEEVYVTHLHLDHLGSLNIPWDVPTYLPSREAAEALSRSWWFGWRQHLLPKTQSFYGFRDVGESGRVRSARVSHSAYPSYALRVDTDDLSVLYTGDLRVERLHPVGGSTLEGLEALSEGGVDVLVVEGTNFGRRMSYVPTEQFGRAVAAILDKYGGSVLFLSVHPADLEAALSLLELLWERGFTPAFENLYHAKLLDAMISASGYAPSGELFFTPRTSRVEHLDNFEVAFLWELKDRRLAVFVPPYGAKDAGDIARALGREPEGLVHVAVLGEPVGEEWIIEERKLENWLKLLGITSLRIHVSGHYYPYELREILRVVRPKRLIPIHTRAPDAMLALFNRYGAGP